MHQSFTSSRALFVAPLALSLTALVGGCSAPRNSGADDTIEPAVNVDVRQVGSLITGACRLETVGLPCDPDGDGSATECEGLCWVSEQAQVSCLALADVNLVETDLNGRICGDEQGRDCSRSCENGECVDKNARLGTACRPGANTTTCDGVCTLVAGEPVCDEVSVCDNVEISQDGCTLTACNFESFEQECATFELTNQVCEASQNEVDAGAFSDAGTGADASPGSTSSVTADAAAVTGDDSESPSRSDAGTMTSSSTGSSSSRSTSTSTQATSNTEETFDGGVASPRTPVRVVGGACHIGSNQRSGLAALSVLALVALFGRRKRSAR